MFIETICVENGVALNLGLHDRRMNRTRKVFYPDAPPIDLSEFLPDFSMLRGRCKCRVSYARDLIDVEHSPCLPRSFRRLRLVNDDEIDYAHKRADREALNRLFALRGMADDVLIVRNGLLTDTSIANIALFDENRNRWLTPARPLLKGTKREQLLAEGILTESDLRAEQLPEFTRLRLFNALIHWGEAEIDVDNISYSDEPCVK